MLLGHQLLSAPGAAPERRARDAAARVWRYRERIELEAADQFARLAAELSATGASPAVIELARAAAADERHHATLCRRLVDRFAPALAPLPPVLGQRLGPAHLSRRGAALYGTVAMSCITETLSAALLLHMREVASHGPVAATVQRILKDEIGHSRLGWAHLAHEAERGDVSWLSPHIPAMLREALAADLEPMTTEGRDLSAYGILPAARVHAIVRQAVAEVIAPGLARHGVAAQLPMMASRSVPLG